jgi:hypothetical protein
MKSTEERVLIVDRPQKLRLAGGRIISAEPSDPRVEYRLLQNVHFPQDRVYSFAVRAAVRNAVKKALKWLLVALLCLPLLGQGKPDPRSQSASADSVFANAAAAAAQADKGNPDVKVWVNTASGVYHCPGSRWYGNTRQGQYMTQAEAQEKHYRPAYGKVCR